MSTVREEGQEGPRVRLRWRLDLHAPDVGAMDSTSLRRAVNSACCGMEPGQDVLVVVRGPISDNVGAGTYVGQQLSGARTVEVQACGRGARHFTEELMHAARTCVEPWVDVA